MPQRVLFVCLGNACRSQMAEGFARVYGADVIDAASAGLTPAMTVPAETLETMAEKNIDISTQFPKPLSIFPRGHFDLVINMSGHAAPGYPEARKWTVSDPIGGSPAQYRASRDAIEQMVMMLILELRRREKAAGGGKQ